MRLAEKKNFAYVYIHEKKLGLNIFFNASFALLLPDYPSITIHFLTTEDKRDVMIKGKLLSLPPFTHTVYLISESHNEYPITISKSLLHPYLEYM